MNEDTSKAGSSRLGAVLLPAAQIALHVKDADIRAAANALAADWRFARVKFDIRDGSIDSAIAHYERESSPELVIVETATIGDGFTARLETLAANCSGNTSAVVIGPVNDVYLYRKLIDMGVSDYLVRPVTQTVLAEVISKTLTEKLGVPDSRLIAVTGAKGGVGASTVAQGIARTIADSLNEKTIILDAAGGWSYLAVGMGTEPMTSFKEITRLAASDDEAAFNRMIFAAGERLSVLATGADSMLDDLADAEQLERVIAKLMVTYPVVVADLSGAAPLTQRAVMSRANETVIVSTPSLPSLRAARTLMQEARSLRGDSGDNIHLVINRSGEAPGQEVAKNDIEKAMESRPAAIIPHDVKIVRGGEATGKNFLQAKGAEDLARLFRDLAEILTGRKSPVKGAGSEKNTSLFKGMFKKKGKG